MESVSKKIPLVAICLLANVYLLHAQIDLSRYEVGLSGGVMVYQGDLTPETAGSYRTMKPQVALHVYRILSPAFSLRLNINRGKLYGNDAKYANPEWRRQRNFSFTTPVTELSVQAVWSFLPSNTSRFSPYLFAGAGVSFLNISRDWSNIAENIFAEGGEVQTGLVKDAATPLPRAIPVIPVGAGVRYSLNDRFSLIGESSYRFSKTDYLDGFSQSANPDKNDHYLSHSIGIIYSFFKKTKALGCPVVRL